MPELQLPPLDEGYVHIFYPGDGNIAAVPEIALPHYYKAGWRLLVPDDVPAQKAPEDPGPLTVSQAKAAGAKATNK